MRDASGEIHVLVNRCAHRSAQFCPAGRGTAKEFICPYHQWTYDLGGNLIGVPFRRGYRGQGGMPADFRLEEHGLQRLSVARRHGVVFASFSPEPERFDRYLAKPCSAFDLASRAAKPPCSVPALTDPEQLEADVREHQGSLPCQPLYVFLNLRALSPRSAIGDRDGCDRRHGVLVSRRGEQQETSDPRCVFKPRTSQRSRLLSRCENSKAMPLS